MSMRRKSLGVAGMAALTLMAAGCMSAQPARYIYQDGEYGVVGIPQNSPFGRRDYRKQAEELMARHFPEGYEIVRAEEVVEGQRVLDKSRKNEIETDPSLSALNQKINLGRLAQTTTTQQKDSLPILESRIIYRRRPRERANSLEEYSASAAQVPEFYLDPNEMARCREKIELAELRGKCAAAIAQAEKDAKKPVDLAAKPKNVKADTATPADPAVKPAAHDGPK